MAKLVENKEKLLRMSKSSCDLIHACERKFVLQRGLQWKQDSEQDTTATDVGSALHQVLEETRHMEDTSNFDQIFETAHKAYNVSEAWQVYNRLMLGKYPEFRKDAGYKTVLVEACIQDTNFIGYIDLVEVNPNGYWQITDIKTAAGGYFNLPQKLASTHKNLQLNLYSRKKFLLQIIEQAKEAGFVLDINKFLGASLRSALKPSASQLPSVESLKQNYCIDIPPLTVARMLEIAKKAQLVNHVNLIQDMLAMSNITTYAEAYELSKKKPFTGPANKLILKELIAAYLDEEASNQVVSLDVLAGYLDKEIQAVNERSKVNSPVRMGDWVEVFVPASGLNPDETWKQLANAQARALELQEGGEPSCNRERCMDFFKPCEYYSVCYGATYEELLACSATTFSTKLSLPIIHTPVEVAPVEVAPIQVTVDDFI